MTHRLVLTGSMARYNWGINGMSLDMSRPGALRFLMRQGQRVRVIFANTTTMYHPMHIHGHTFAAGPAGTRKDTVIVLPRQQGTLDSRLLHAFWRLCEQLIGAVERAQDSRSAHAAAARAGMSVDVRVVALR